MPVQQIVKAVLLVMGNVKTVVTIFINGISYATEIVKIGDLKEIRNE